MLVCLHLREEKNAERRREERREGEGRKPGRAAESRDRAHWRQGTLNPNYGGQSKSKEALKRLHEVLK